MIKQTNMEEKTALVARRKIPDSGRRDRQPRRWSGDRSEEWPVARRHVWCKIE